MGLPVLPALKRQSNTGNRRIMTTILGLESSCDDTAAAIVRETGGRREILSSVVYGQTALHCT